MTEFNSGRGGRDDDIVDLEAQPVNATGNSAEGSSREPIKQEPLSGTVTVAHIVYCLHSISILIGLLTAGLSIAGAFVFSAPSIPSGHYQLHIPFRMHLELGWRVIFPGKSARFGMPCFGSLCCIW